MSASLVGSEMCIRDRSRPRRVASTSCLRRRAPGLPGRACSSAALPCSDCLLYTSDAADDM
eukprot:11671506-Alexandrium_andersonii.AAC.1